jgi:tetratricopeptide (TPR) repeat protein
MKPWSRMADRLLLVLAVAFAFLAASFAARNSDLFLHLASGRLLAEGGYTFGVDPFAYTTGGAYWANHSWLFDLGLYAGHNILGGSALVVLKALAVAATAGLLLFLSRGVKPNWIAAGCVVVAILAMTPRLLLQPAVVSFLLLAVCLVLLRAGGRALFALPAVIVLWVNLDSWVLLGPVLVLLFAIGERFSLVSPGQRRLPLWLLPACLAACLCSPHHIHALALPAELSPAVWRSTLRQDSRFAGLFASPWQWGPLVSAGGLNLAAWAYFVLLGLGVLSFLVNRRACRDWRGPVWLVFALLAAWQARLVPFFAVVAAPITALNFGECVSPAALPRTGRIGALLLGLVLVALTWPGWLQGAYRRDRALRWEVVVDPSLHRAAETVRRWRRDGHLPAHVRTFAVHPDVAHYLAWFCPGEKTFFDSRWQLFLSIADQYERLSGLFGAVPIGMGHPGEAEAALQEHDIGCVVLYDPDLRRLAPGLRLVVGPGAAWELLHLDGQAVLLGWKKAMTGPLAALHSDVEHLPFGHGAEEVFPLPARWGPQTLAQPLPWWHAYLHPPSDPPWEAATAAILVRLNEDAAPDHRRQLQQRIACQTAEVLGLAPLAAGSVGGATSLAASLALGGHLLPDAAELPAGLPLLGTTAARRAVAARPDHAGAWLVLAEAYLALGRGTLEATAPGELQPLARVRHIQIITALTQAVTLDPDLTAAHDLLATQFLEQGQYDLALQHREAQLRLTRASGPAAGEGREAFARRLEQLTQAVEAIRGVVLDNEARFLVHSDGLAGSPLARARVAVQLGLPTKAVDDVLLRSHPDLYGIDGLRLLLDLLLQTGRAQSARDLLDREELRKSPTALGFVDISDDRRHIVYRFPAYDWFDVCQSAAAGDYDRAAGALERLRTRLEHEGERVRVRAIPAASWMMAAEVALGTSPFPLLSNLPTRLERERFLSVVVRNEFQVVERADLHVVEGLLLLEAGAVNRAAAHFHTALPLYSQAVTGPTLPGQLLALRYLREIKGGDW